MDFRLFIALSYLMLHVLACERNDVPMAINSESEHFVLITNTQLSNTSEVDETLNKAEDLYSKILQVLGENRTPESRITIRLEGDFEDRGPYYDNQGIHLFRYTAQENGYLAALAHEMVHAFREAYYIEYDPWSWASYPFLDEGLAEYVAQLVDGSKTGFPWYGYNEYAVVGDLVLSNNLIPHDILRAQHHEINDQCNIQAYPQRSSWMRFIDETYGRDTLLHLNYPETAPTTDYFTNTLGVSLSAVDSTWQSWVIQKYNSIPQAAQIAEAYRNRTSWYKYCQY